MLLKRNKIVTIVLQMIKWEKNTCLQSNKTVAHKSSIMNGGFIIKVSN